MLWPIHDLQALDSAVGPRHVKWHHPAWLLPPAVPASGRVIYVYRNPKDTVVSCTLDLGLVWPPCRFELFLATHAARCPRVL